MATLAPHQPAETAPSHWQEGNPSEDALAHIPGEGGWPIVGNTFKMLADPHGQTRRMVEKYGRVYKNRAFGGWNVALIGAEANEMLLMNRDKIFSSEQGWGPIRQAVPAWADAARFRSPPRRSPRAVDRLQARPDAALCGRAR